MNERISIGQREVAIIAPLKNSDDKSEIVTVGMTPCFAFSLRDPEAGVGLLTHVDVIGDIFLGKMLNEVIPTLKKLGVHKLIVETANVKGRIGKKIFIKYGIKILKENGFEIITSTNDKGRVAEWRDVGKSYGALLSIKDGLRGFTYNEGEKILAPEEKGVQDFKGIMKEARRLFSNPNIIIKHIPSI